MQNRVKGLVQPKGGRVSLHSLLKGRWVCSKPTQRQADANTFHARYGPGMTVKAVQSKCDM